MNAVTRNTLLAVCLLTGSLGVAQAAPSDGPPSVKVSYADLDLSTADGNQQLYTRITQAARVVCPAADPRVTRFASSAKCRREAIARAVRNVNNPQLVALAASHLNHG